MSCTQYKIESVTGPEEILEKFNRDMLEDRVIAYSHGTTLGAITQSNVYWAVNPKNVDLESDLKKISIDYPNLLLVIRVYDRNENIFQLWVKNGSLISIQGKIVFNEPNLKLLPDVDWKPDFKKELIKERDRLEQQIKELGD